MRCRSLTGTGIASASRSSGLSKVCGMPQMKLGWIVASGPGMKKPWTDWNGSPTRSFLSVLLFNAPRRRCFSARDEYPARNSDTHVTQPRRVFVRCAIADSPCRVLRVEGGWYATLQVPDTQSEEE